MDRKAETASEFHFRQHGSETHRRAVQILDLLKNIKAIKSRTDK